MPGEDRDLGRDFPWLTDMTAATVPGVFAFAVLAYDDPVEIARFAAGKWGGDATQELGGPDVCVLLEWLADGEAEAPEGYVVGYIY